MFPEAMNSADIKKVSELWDEEKKYRWWIIGFAISLVVLFAINLAFVIMAYILKPNLINYFMTLFTENKQANALREFDGLVVTSITMTVALFLSCFAFIYSVYNCYKAKSFEKLDSLSSMFIGFQTFYSVFGLFQLIFRNSIYFGNTFMIFYFFLPFLSIPVWLLLSRQVRKIKRSFFIAKRQEEISAFYAANQGQMGANSYQSPFGFPFPQKNPDYANHAHVVDDSAEIQKKDPKFSKLQLMSVSQLRKIADKLSISGNKEMKKPELIKAIISVSQSFEVENSEENNVNPDNDVDIES